MPKDFESFLMDKYSDEVRYTENDMPNKDLWVDKFNDWLCELDVEDWLKYGDKYAIERKE